MLVYLITSFAVVVLLAATFGYHRLLQARHRRVEAFLEEVTAAAGRRPSALWLLVACASLQDEALAQRFARWERTIPELIKTPLSDRRLGELAPKNNDTLWLSSLIAVADAVALLLAVNPTRLESAVYAGASLLVTVEAAADILVRQLRVEPVISIIGRDQFHVAYSELPVHELGPMCGSAIAYQRFTKLRQRYAGKLRAIRRELNEREFAARQNYCPDDQSIPKNSAVIEDKPYDNNFS